LEIQKARGIKRVRKTKTGYSTDVAALEQFTGHPLVKKMLEYRQLAKLKSNLGGIAGQQAKEAQKTQSAQAVAAAQAQKESRPGKPEDAMTVLNNAKDSGVFFVEEQGREREKPCGWKSFTVRCNQADRIRRVIDEQAFRHFRAPRKWLFPTPRHPACSLDDQPTILVAEFQDLVPRDDNERAWRHSVTEAHLHELYAILEAAGGVTSRPENIALTGQGWFAFIDTEYPRDLHDYESIVPYLSRQMRQHWSRLIRRAGSETMQP